MLRQEDSARTVSRFILSLAMILAWYVLVHRRFQQADLTWMLSIAAGTTAMIALYMGERLGFGPLNRWDECASYLGLAALAHRFG
ncbi:MAG: hypothetical protein IT562_13345 [Alphaproteobacteria bacterium]|nr:hypothetical protein [Alphaproteobacteria bacterium]